MQKRLYQMALFSLILLATTLLAACGGNRVDKQALQAKRSPAELFKTKDRTPWSILRWPGLKNTAWSIPASPLR